MTHHGRRNGRLESRRLSSLVLSATVLLQVAPASASAIPRFVFVDGSDRFAERIACRSWGSRPGFALTVLHRGRSVLSEQCGLADLGRGVPVDGDTRFRATPVGKTLISAAALLLHEERALSLDERLSSFFPGLPEWAQRIRVLDVLNHTAGLPEFRDETGLPDSIDGEWVLAFLARRPRPAFEPGSSFAESESGYLVLTELIERTSGLRWIDFVEDRILRPLGMHETRLVDGPAAEVPARAIGYRSTGDGFEIDRSPSDTPIGSFEVFTTVGDLTRWYSALAEHELLTPRSTRMMFHFPLTSSGSVSSVAMGWVDRTVPVDARRHAGLRGFATGDSSMELAFYPDEELCVILLGNADRLPAFLDDALSHYLIDVPRRKAAYPADDPFGRERGASHRR
ncbi:MAG TPA: serine hydrolase domain-containing protein [Candidatus Polarisedimenticolaceae bacterium]|nr:serine hydrolase domain-containing protein [Candidatus Polarisedimenticolaceae bacterium]